MSSPEGEGSKKRKKVRSKRILRQIDDKDGGKSSTSPKALSNFHRTSTLTDLHKLSLNYKARDDKEFSEGNSTFHVTLKSQLFRRKCMETLFI